LGTIGLDDRRIAVHEFDKIDNNIGQKDSEKYCCADE
jgi:hypothetical protein